MIEDIRAASDEHDAERPLSWRAGSVSLAALDVDDAELPHGWRSDRGRAAARPRASRAGSRHGRPMYRLIAETHTDNAPALAVLTRSGFTQEGTSRAACLHRPRQAGFTLW
ncbi:hypothetical protein ACIPWL_19375 [Streptomyces sp. NPDC090023]|uniref:hypothetical protein n=1 Tax=unclassified Streptomyces TaxID=2593676 RepID=UPI00381F2DDA